MSLKELMDDAIMRIEIEYLEYSNGHIDLARAQEMQRYILKEFLDKATRRTDEPK